MLGFRQATLRCSHATVGDVSPDVTSLPLPRRKWSQTWARSSICTSLAHSMPHLRSPRAVPRKGGRLREQLQARAAPRQGGRPRLLGSRAVPRKGGRLRCLPWWRKLGAIVTSWKLSLRPLCFLCPLRLVFVLRRRSVRVWSHRQCHHPWFLRRRVCIHALFLHRVSMRRRVLAETKIGCVLPALNGCELVLKCRGVW